VLKLARPLADVVWDLDTEGKPTDTPERRAAVQRDVLHRVDQIADPTVRDHYRAEMRSRLNKMRQPDGQPWWGAGPRKPFRGQPGAPVAPFPPGAAARAAVMDLDGSRQVQVLLGVLVERPSLLRILYDEVSRLEIASPELRRLQGGLLDALSLFPEGIDPAADDMVAEGEVPLETRIITDHLQRSGLGPAAEAARVKARGVFRKASEPSDVWIDRWRRTASHLNLTVGGADELKQNAEDLAQDYTDENLQKMEDMRLRRQRENFESGTG